MLKLVYAQVKDRIEMALELSMLDVASIPLNVLNPIPAGANSCITGNMLTTTGTTIQSDKKLVNELLNNEVV